MRNREMIVVAILFVAVAILTFNCTAGEEPTNQEKEEERKSLSDKRVLLVIPSNEFIHREYGQTRDALEKQGATITVASSVITTCTGTKEQKVEPDTTIEKVKIEDYEAIVFIGGPGAAEYFDNKEVAKIVQTAYKQKKVVAAICNAPIILANAGALKGKKVTCIQTAANLLKEKGINRIDKPVQTDGRIVTGRDPKSSAEFGKAVAELLASIGRLDNKKVAMIIAPDKFRDEEFKVPKEKFEKEGAEIKVVSKSTAEVTGMLGMKVKPDITLAMLKKTVKEFDIILFVGGVGAKTYFNNKTAHAIAKEAVKEKKIVAAICIAPLILANSGLLKDKKATIWRGMSDELQKKGVKYTGSDTETDGRIVTAIGPTVADAFAEAVIIAYLKNR